MLGVPESDSEIFRDWSDKLATSLGRGPDIETQYDMADYFYKKIDRNSNGNNLISRLSTVEMDGRKLSMHQSQFQAVQKQTLQKTG